jgi:protein-L-isoaspartate(D-aspartate) O-methyltransferase
MHPSTIEWTEATWNPVAGCTILSPGCTNCYAMRLAARLAANFANASNVKAVRGDGTAVEFDAADVILVNAGATQPAELWLDRLRDGGRLILPLTAAGFPAEDGTQGAVFRIERRDVDFLARSISSVGIFPCEGARDPVSEAALSAAFAKGGVDEVTRLYRHNDVPEADCWLRGKGWCLAYR